MILRPYFKNSALRIWYLVASMACGHFYLNAQTVIGGDTIDQSAILDIQDTAKGVLLSRLTTAQRDAIVKPAFGLIFLNTSKRCIEANIGSPEIPEWKCLTIGVPNITAIDTQSWNTKLSGDRIMDADRNIIHLDAKADPIRATNALLSSNSIVLNATGDNLYPNSPFAFHVKPIRGVAMSSPVLIYNPTTGEITYNLSDSRLKGNIQPMTEGLKRVLMLRPVTYNQKNALTDRDYAAFNRSGFIAQEVQTVFPDIVHPIPGPDSLLTIATQDMIPAMVKAIQELSQKVENLETQNAALQEQVHAIHALEKEIVSLKAKKMPRRRKHQ